MKGVRIEIICCLRVFEDLVCFYMVYLVDVLVGMLIGCVWEFIKIIFDFY